MPEMKAAVIHEPGANEVLKIERWPAPKPDCEEVLMREGLRTQSFRAFHSTGDSLPVGDSKHRPRSPGGRRDHINALAFRRITCSGCPSTLSSDLVAGTQGAWNRCERNQPRQHRDSRI